MPFYRQIASRLAALGVGTALPGCTPTTHNCLTWTVVNATADTLRVSIRYPLDSVALALPEQFARVRQCWEHDSSAAAGRGYYDQPLRRLAYHRGHWYLVDSRIAGLNGLPGAGGPVRSRGRSGLLTYTLPPAGTQSLLRPAYAPADGQVSIPCMQALWLRQGTTCRVVLPGRAFARVFRPGRVGQAAAPALPHHYQLTVGPGLTLNE